MVEKVACQRTIGVSAFVELRNIFQIERFQYHTVRQALHLVHNVVLESFHAELVRQFVGFNQKTRCNCSNLLSINPHHELIERGDILIFKFDLASFAFLESIVETLIEKRTLLREQRVMQVVNFAPLSNDDLDNFGCTVARKSERNVRPSEVYLPSNVPRDSISIHDGGMRCEVGFAFAGLSSDAKCWEVNCRTANEEQDGGRKLKESPE